MRTNYQIFVFENYNNPSPPPSPFGNGWKRDINGNTVPVKSTTTSAPDTIRDSEWTLNPTMNFEVEFHILYFICVKVLYG